MQTTNTPMSHLQLKTANNHDYNHIDITNFDRDRFILLEQHSHSYTWEVDLNGQFTYISPGITYLLGYQPENLLGQFYFCDLLTSEFKDLFINDHILDQALTNSCFEWSHQQVHLNGDALTFLAYISPLKDSNHQILGYRAVNLDITKQLNTLKALSTTEERMRTIITVSNIGAWEYDSQTSVYWCSDEYFTMLGYDAQRFPQTGRFPGPFQDLLDSLLNVEDLKGAQERLSNYMNSDSDQFYDSYFRMKKADGTWAWIRSRGRRVRDADGNLTKRMIGTHIDVTDLKDIESDTLKLSYTDQLTGVYNRRYFEDQMSLIDREENLPITVFMADVNGLKLINDAFGHAAGDALLVKASKVISEVFRSTDTVARIGGDEFVIMMPKTNAQQANNLLTRIQTRLLSETIMGINVSVAIGSSTKESASISLSDTFKTAETLMYQIKINNKEKNRLHSIQVIIDTLFRECPIEESHGTQVASMCSQIGIQLGLNTSQIQDLYTIGLFHDIGKVAISKELLTKKSSYSPDDWEEYYRHAEIGYNIMSSANAYAPFANDILHHHEHWDGTGYPRAISGDAIPFFARILAVSDAYEALSSGIRHEIPASETTPLSAIIEHSGSYFDPLVVNALKKILRDTTHQGQIN